MAKRAVVVKDKPQQAQTPEIVQPEKPKRGLSVVKREDATPATMVERMAKDPNVDVAKLRELIEMQKDVQAHNAKASFHAAFAEMQAEIPTIAENGRTDKGRYATFEDIVDTVRPILRKHGFALNFRTEWPDKETVKVIGVLTHRDGHAQESQFMSEADQSGSKNSIQALGSAVSYGRRYTTRDLLNIASRGEDDDGQRAGRSYQRETPPPAGFDGKADAPISNPQRKRLFVIVKKSGREEMDFRSWLKDVYHVNSTKEIKRKDYDAICRAVEAKGPLPMPAPREGQ